MSKGTWDIWVMAVRKRGKQAIVLAVGRKCRKHWSDRDIPRYALQPFIVPKTR
jgi:hypothetical protein